MSPRRTSDPGESRKESTVPLQPGLESHKPPSHLPLFFRSDSPSPVQYTLKEQGLQLHLLKECQRLCGYTLNSHNDHVFLPSPLSLPHKHIILSPHSNAPAPSSQLYPPAHSLILLILTQVSVCRSSHTHRAAASVSLSYVCSLNRNILQTFWHRHLLPIRQTELDLHLLRDAFPVPPRKS